ncbi:MAG: hypothetical protein HY438_01680 [DPANN group archaeon]|nr:hypothetical protein [DPANN group archaeon]
MEATTMLLQQIKQMPASQILNGRTYEPRLEVMRVRQNFVAPYRKYRFLFVDKQDLKTRKQFVKRLENVSASWPQGTYYLKLSNGLVFARFDVSERGKVKKLYEASPATSKPYPVWEWFN